MENETTYPRRIVLSCPTQKKSFLPTIGITLIVAMFTLDFLGVFIFFYFKLFNKNIIDNDFNISIFV